MKELWNQITTDPSGVETAAGIVIVLSGIIFLFTGNNSQVSLGIIATGAGLLTGTAFSGRAK